MRRSLVALTTLAIALALLACSNQNAPGVSNATTQSGNAVSIKDNAFSPPNLQTAAGAEVKWANSDSVEHQLVADDGSFDSGTIPEGRAFRLTFSKPGTYTYHCKLHSYASEKGSIIVK